MDNNDSLYLVKLIYKVLSGLWIVKDCEGFVVSRYTTFLTLLLNDNSRLLQGYIKVNGFWLGILNSNAPVNVTVSKVNFGICAVVSEIDL